MPGGPASIALRELIEEIPGARLVAPDGSVASGADTPIVRIAPRADLAEPGDLFVCVKGVTADGHDFAPQAIARGAVALVVERPLAVAVPQVLVADARLAVALCAVALAGRPADALDVIGVTGTNGKTTSAYLLRSVLGAAGRPCGLVGTVETIVGGAAIDAAHTTPDPRELQSLFARMVAAGDTACAMEVSSHALDQRRVAGVPFAAALFTNLTRDHLDYHPSVEAYYQAKRALFLRPEGDGMNPPGAVNLDDEFGRRLAAEAGALGYAIHHEADVAPESYRIGAGGTWAEVRTPRGVLEMETKLRGEFNLANVLGVIAVGEILGLDHGDVAAGIAALRGVPGRLEPVEAGQRFPVLVDYAHTPDSLENVLHAVRDLAGAGRVIVVAGCGGDRDRGKRPLMGAIARRLADIAIITSDNPRSEDPDAIIAEIVAGATDGPARMVIQPDRHRAIAEAIAAADDHDIVLIAGKGHERGQEIAGVIAPFDDREVAYEVLSNQERP